jgi:predicted transposase/invertase (TIGR01784 family)
MSMKYLDPKEEKLFYDKNWGRISSEKTILSKTKAEGRAEGRAEERIETAKKAKAMGMSVKDISKLTGLSEQEIEKL